jgi:hypothetical protein
VRVVQKFLLWIHNNPRWAWPILLAYAAVATFPHENVQYVVNEIALKISHRRLYQASAGIALLEAALLTWILYRGIKDQPARRPIAIFWAVTLALIFGTWRLLTANNVELVHYPQYVPEGAILLAITLSPIESIAWVTIFGGLDECFQYWDLMGGKRVPYDFNDIYMDLLGGAAGVLITMAFLRCERSSAEPWSSVFKRRGVHAALAITVLASVLAISGFMLLYEDKTNTHYWFALSRDKPPEYFFINPMFGPHRFHTLSPVEGPVLIFLTFALYAAFDRRVRVIAKHASRER